MLSRGNRFCPTKPSPPSANPSTAVRHSSSRRTASRKCVVDNQCPRYSQGPRGGATSRGRRARPRPPAAARGGAPVIYSVIEYPHPSERARNAPRQGHARAHRRFNARSLVRSLSLSLALFPRDARLLSSLSLSYTWLLRSFASTYIPVCARPR